MNELLQTPITKKKKEKRIGANFNVFLHNLQPPQYPDPNAQKDGKMSGLRAVYTTCAH